MAAPSHDAFVAFRRGARLEHLRGLDGLRGIAVIVVVLFHGGWSWMSGGFLGVSLFFTLSGFLITSLLIAEFDTSGYVDMGSFWKRRFRRLLPASWLTLGLVVIATALLGIYRSSDRLDVVAALFNVANWRFLASGSSYNDLFAEPSPVRHFWSLAIEEQAYVVLPLIVAISLKVGRGSRRVLAAVLGALLALSVVLNTLSNNIDRIYYGTDTRAAEILIGALLAVAVTSKRLRIAVVDRLTERSLLIATSTLAFVVFIVASIAVEVTSSFVVNGGLIVTGGLSAIMVFAAAAGVGPLAGLCSLAPLRWVGQVSYGIYLFHWPLLVLLTQRRTGLSRGPRFVLAVVLTLVLAELSSRYFEGPLRRGTIAPALQRRISVARGSISAVALASVMAMVVLVAAVPTTSARFDAESAQDALAGLAESIPQQTQPDGTASGAATPTTAQLQDRAPTIMSFGDSVALSITMPLIEWGKATGDWIYVGGSVELGCGIGRGGNERSNFTAARRAVCDSWPARWGAVTDVDGLDIALVHTGQWDIVDRQLPGDSIWRHVGDPVYDAYLLDEFAAAQELLSRRGALVMWVNLPQYSHLDDDSLADNIRESHDPLRVARLNQLMAEHVAKYPESARLIDLASWMDDKIDDTTLRSDGTHFNEVGADRLVSDFMRSALLDGWNDWRRAKLNSGSN